MARPLPDWIPTADHYPTPKKAGGKLTWDNVRLAHRGCNWEDAARLTRKKTRKVRPGWPTPLH
jgi:5-methylcytosine-specific restriction endonuclease McrA